jgi:hypothetical protein
MLTNRGGIACDRTEEKTITAGRRTNSDRSSLCGLEVDFRAQFL